MFKVVFLLLSFIVGAKSAFVVTSQGTEGTTCGEQICIKDEASCEKKTLTCVCDEPQSSGIGSLCCHNGDKLLGTQFYERGVEATTLSEESSILPYPCRYRVTNVDTDLRIKKPDGSFETQGECNVVISAWNGFYDGGYYVDGFDLAIRAKFERQHCRGRDSVIEATYSISGNASNGVYDFTERSEKKFKKEGTHVCEGQTVISREESGVQIDMHVDKEQNLAFFRSRACGIQIKFRPYNRNCRRQRQTAGLCVTINQEENNPRFNENNIVMGLTPSIKLDDLDGDLPLEHRYLLRAYKSLGDVKQKQNSPSICRKNPLHQCKGRDLKRALQLCEFIYYGSDYSKWYRRNDAHTIAKDINSCYDAVCNGGRACEAFVDFLKNGERWLRSDKHIDAFLAPGFCKTCG